MYVQSLLYFATYRCAKCCLGPVVLNVDSSPNISGIDWKELPEHREEGQVELDVNRSFVYYPTGAYRPAYPTHTAAIRY